MRYHTPARSLVALPMLLALLLAACGSAPASAPATSVNASTSANASTATNAPRQCSYTYAGSDDPALAAKIRANFAGSGKATLDVNVREVGENEPCNDGSSRLPLQGRDFSVTLPAADLADRQTLEQPLSWAMNMTGSFAREQGDRVIVTFMVGTEQLVCKTRLVGDCVQSVMAVGTTSMVAASPSIALSTNSIGMGMKLGIAGSGFDPGEEVVLRIANHDAARVRADGHGTFAEGIVVPCYEFCASGASTQLVAAGSSSGKAAQQPLMMLLVLPSRAPASPRATPGQ